MDLVQLIQRTAHRGRSMTAAVCRELVRKPYWRLQGMRIGSGVVMTTVHANWPHKISIGAGCHLEPGIFFKFDGIWSPGRAIVVGDRVFLGRDTEFNVIDRVDIAAHVLIGSCCKFIDHDHGMAAGELVGPQRPSHSPIVVGEGAWLGANVIVLQGVRIGAGAVVGAAAVVTQSVPDNEIWAGVPARRIASRASYRASPDAHP